MNVCVCGESKERKTVQLSEQTSGGSLGYFFVEWGEQVGGGGRWGYQASARMLSYKIKLIIFFRFCSLKCFYCSTGKSNKIICPLAIQLFFL